jgi:hypothetical protein
MPTSITTDANLINGVGAFPPERPDRLDRLTPPHLKDVGRDIYHQVAWTRCLADLAQKGIDEDYVDTDAQTQLKPAVCHLVMHLLYQQNIVKVGDKNEAQSKFHKNAYDRIWTSVQLELSSGTIAAIGEGFNFRRG